jgi:hypothetical protein
MDDVDRQLQAMDRFDDSSSEKRKPLAIVAKVPVLIPVKMIAIEVMGLVDQVYIDLTVGYLRFENMRRHRLASHIDDKGDVGIGQVGCHSLRTAICGEKQRTGMSNAGQMNRKCTAYIGEATRLGKRDRFACGHRDMHDGGLTCNGFESLLGSMQIEEFIDQHRRIERESPCRNVNTSRVENFYFQKSFPLRKLDLGNGQKSWL